MCFSFLFFLSFFEYFFPSLRIPVYRCLFRDVLLFVLVDTFCLNVSSWTGSFPPTQPPPTTQPLPRSPCSILAHSPRQSPSMPITQRWLNTHWVVLPFLNHVTFFVYFGFHAHLLNPSSRDKHETGILAPSRLSFFLFFFCFPNYLFRDPTFSSGTTPAETYRCSWQQSFWLPLRP